MTCLLLYLWQTILFLSCNVYLIQTKALKCVFTPDTYQNDITWWLEQIDESGIATLIAEGSGSTNKMETPVGLTVDDNACLRYRILDSYGDGGGFITVYWGDDLTTPSTTFLNHAFSAAYNAGNGGGDPGTSEFLFQDGVGVLGTVCSFDSMTKPDTGCHEDIAVDIIFVMDTSSDLTQYCQSHYWDAIIDLVEHHVPRTDLQIAIVTYGSDDVDHLLFRPFSTPKDGIATSHDIKSCSFGFQGSWVNYLRPMLQSFGSSECIGGGHSTISALDMAIQMFANKYGQMYDPSRRRYIILMTDSTIDVDQTQTFDSDPYSSFILLSASDAPNPHLSRLIAHDDNLILLESFSQIKDAYVLVEDIVCSTEIDIAVTEIFIDDMNNRYWFEIVNLGRPLNVSELVFGGNLFTGSALDNAEIPQGDLFVIGNMFGSSDTPCDIYGGDIASSSLNYDCTNYYAVDYDGNATLSSFSLSINDRYGSEIAANALEIEAGYSYELSTIYLGFSNMTNWRESCDRYGSPGRFGRQYCNARSCDAVKCASRGDVSATCYGTCTTVQEGSSSDFIGDWEFCAPSNGCNCGLNYYYDENDTRSCIDVPTVVDCSAYVIQADANLIEVTWTASPYENAAFYSIKYGDSGVTDGLTDPDDQNIQITFSEYAISPVRMTVIGTDANDNSVVESTETICIYGQTLNPTSTPTAVPSVAPIQQTKAPTFAGGCGSSLRLDLMIIMDSSGSVYNRETGEDPFKYWNNELDFVKTIVNKSLPGDSRVGAINFSGCGSSYDKTTCRYTAGQLVRLWGLLDFGMPNDQEALYNRFDQIDSNDFIGGKTWTDEALGIALAEFKANSTAGRKRMILLLTDGEPYPRTDTYDHDPCYRKWNNDTKQFYLLHESDNLLALRELDVTILTVGIGLSSQFIHQFFECLVTDFNEHFWEASDFSALDSLVESIAAIVCSVRIELIINEVGLLSGCDGYVTNGTDSNELIWFIELYNAGAGVSLDGFEFQGMINYQITSTEYVDQGEYWVISTFDMTTMDQTEAGCRGCGQDLLIDPMCADTTMDNDYWDLKLLDTSGNEIEFVERNPNSFPPVDKCHTHELQWEDWDNSFGGNWEQSCYVFGTPQDPNQESCLCDYEKCRSRGDLGSYCDTGAARFGNSVIKCVCSSNYISSGGVCVPLYQPDCCFAWEDDCANGNMLLTWCALPTDVVAGYRLYKDDVQLGDTLSSYTTSALVDNAVCGSQTPKTNFSVVAVFQINPLIQSAKTFCPPLPPTPAPTASPTTPTGNPTQPTEDPTMSPTNPTTAKHTTDPTQPTVSPTQLPSTNPTPFPSRHPIMPTESYSHFHAGPFFYPNGDKYSDPIYIIFGAHNATHFFLNLFVEGDHWFGFAFASGTGCTQSLSDNNQCRMDETDAIIFGDYGGSDSLTVKEYILGNHTSPTLQRTQNIGSDVSSQLFDGVRDFTVRVKRPYDPSMYGNRNGYVINSPLAGSFCWLWAQGDGIFFGPSAGHLNRGSECVDMGGTTVAPTPSPSYAPSAKPTTAKPSKPPSVLGDTEYPTPDPTKAPTSVPSEVTGAPSTDPIVSPTPGPTVVAGVPTRGPTHRPSPSPTDEPTGRPTKSPVTASPTDSTIDPTQSPTKSPVTASPTNSTVVPTIDTTRNPTSFPSMPFTSTMERVISDEGSVAKIGQTLAFIGVLIAII